MIKWLRKFISFVLIINLTAPSFMSTASAVQTDNTDSPMSTLTKEDEWQTIKQMVSEFEDDFVWKNTNYSNAINKQMPHTALLGNGNVGITSYGNDTEKTYLISTTDFTSDNTRYFGHVGRNNTVITGGGLTIMPYETILKLPEEEEGGVSEHPYNLAYQMPVSGSGGNPKTAVSQESFAGEVMWESNEGHRQYFIIDLKEETVFDRWHIKHAGYYEGNPEAMNTQDFELQISSDGKTWRTIDSVKGNTQNITDRRLHYPRQARWVRINTTKVCDTEITDVKARFAQVELYLDDTNIYTEEQVPKNKHAYETNLATEEKGVTTSASSKFRPSDLIINNDWGSASINNYNGWVSDPKNNEWIQIDFPAPEEVDEIAFLYSGLKEWTDFQSLTGQANAAGWNKFTPRSFNVEISVDGNNFTTLEQITGNVQGHYVYQWSEPISLKSVKVTYPLPEQQNSSARARMLKFYAYNNTKNPTWDMSQNIDEEELFTVSTDLLENEMPLPDEINLDVDRTIEFHEKQAILEGEIQTTTYIGDVPVKLNTWLSPTNNLLVTEITSLSSESERLRVSPWGQTAMPDKLGDSTVISKPVFETNAGIEENMVWSTRQSNIVDDVVRNAGTGAETVYHAKWMSEIAIASKVIGSDDDKVELGVEGSRGIIDIAIPAGETVTVVTAVHTAGAQKVDNPIGADGIAVENALTLLNTIDSQAAVEQLSQERLDWWKDYYLLSYMDMGDKILNRLYYGLNYIFACGTREGSLASGLYGPWITTDGPAWQGDYHLNYNFQSPYYASYGSNHLSEFSQPMFEMFRTYIEIGMRNASRSEDLKSISSWYYNRREEDFKDGFEDAILYPVGVKQHNYDLSSSYLNQTLNALFCATQIASYYQYTLDDNWLLEKKPIEPYDYMTAEDYDLPAGVKMPDEESKYSLYDVLAKTANFYLQWVEKKAPRIDMEIIKDNPSGINGNTVWSGNNITKNYEKYPEYNAEEHGDKYVYILFDGSHEDSFEMNPNVTVGNLQKVLDLLVELGPEKANSQGYETKYDHWKDLAEHLVGMEVSNYTMDTIMANGSHNTSSKAYNKPIFGLSEDRRVRPISAAVNIENIHPGDQLMFDSDPELLEIARNTVEVMGEDCYLNRSAGWMMYNSLPKNFTMAARVGWRQNQLIYRIRNQVNSSRKTNGHINDNNHGWEKVGLVEAFNSMMAQSDSGIIKVFPSWSYLPNSNLDKNGDVFFRNVRTHGGFLVTAKASNQQVQYFELTSEAGQDAKVVIPAEWQSAGVIDSGGRTVSRTIGRTRNSKEWTVEFPTQQGEIYTITAASMDKENLKEMVTLYEASLEEPEYYTAGSWKVFTKALESAKRVMGDESAGAEEIEAAVTDLKTAYEMLEPDILITGMALNRSNLTSVTGRQHEMQVSLQSGDEEDVDNKSVELEWRSSNDQVLTVKQDTDDSKKAQITAAGEGEAAVTVTSPKAGLSATCSVMVIGSVENVNSDIEITDSRVTVNEVVDLDEISPVDWFSFARDPDESGVKEVQKQDRGIIGDFIISGDANNSSDHHILVKFSDGDSIEAVNESTQFLPLNTYGSGGAKFMRGIGEYFEFTVPAKPYEQTLTIFAGGNRSHAKLTAVYEVEQKEAVGTILKTNQAEHKVIGMQPAAHNTNKGGLKYSVTFRSDIPGEQMRIRFEMISETNNPGDGQVLLKSAILEGSPTIETDPERNPEIGDITFSPLAPKLGEKVTITATPKKGYRLPENGVKYNGISAEEEANGQYSFIMPYDHVVITADFIEQKEYMITVPDVIGGTITANKEQAEADETINLKVTPEAGYHLKEGSLQAGNAEISKKDETNYSFTMPEKDVTVTAEFIKAQKEQYKIEISQMSKGRVTANKSQAEAGEIINLTVSPESGYRLKAGTLKAGSAVISKKDESSYSFIMPGGAVRITAEFEVIKKGETVAQKVTSIKVTPGTKQIMRGKSTVCKVSVSPSNAANKAVSWKSSNTKVAVVNASGKVTAKSAGKVTITATAKDGSKISGKATLTVKTPVSKVKFGQTAVTLKEKKSISLPAIGYATDKKAVMLTYKSSKPKVATVSTKGKITAKKAGKTVITAKADNGKSAKLNVTVQKKNAKTVKVTKVSAKVPKTMKVGQTKAITGKYSSTKATAVKVSYKSSKKAIVSVDKSGTLVAKKKGKAIITVKAGNKSKKYTIQVK